MPADVVTAPRTLLDETAAWRVLALLLSRPRAGWHQELQALSRTLEDPLLQAAAAQSGGASDEDYQAVLRPGALLSPREVGHQIELDPGQLMAELRAHYQAFGYRSPFDEPDDHIAVELDFAAYLAFKEAYALARGATEHAQVAQEGRTRFVRAHVAPVLLGMAERAGAVPVPYLRLALEAGAERVRPYAVPAPRLPPALAEDCLHCPLVQADTEAGDELEAVLGAAACRAAP